MSRILHGFRFHCSQKCLLLIESLKFPKANCYVFISVVIYYGTPTQSNYLFSFYSSHCAAQVVAIVITAVCIVIAILLHAIFNFINSIFLCLILAKCLALKSVHAWWMVAANRFVTFITQSVSQSVCHYKCTLGELRLQNSICLLTFSLIEVLRFTTILFKCCRQCKYNHFYFCFTIIRGFILITSVNFKSDIWGEKCTKNSDRFSWNFVHFS